MIEIKYNLRKKIEKSSAKTESKLPIPFFIKVNRHKMVSIRDLIRNEKPLNTPLCSFDIREGIQWEVK